MELNTKVQPLVEDLGRIIRGEFLTSTGYKRWLVEHNLDAVWEQCVSYVRNHRSYFMVGFNHEAADAEDAMGYFVNLIFNQKRKYLPSFLYDLLSFYSNDQLVYINVSDIEKDLLAIGFSKKEVSVLDNISAPEPIEEKIQEEQTQEQKVRLLEKTYLDEIEENSNTAIEAYLKWHSEALLYLSTYYTDANPDFSAFKHMDNSGNGYTLRKKFNSIHSIYNLLMNNVTAQEIAKTVTIGKKTPLLFISHSHDDEEFVIALVNLLEDMGFSKETLFCSSVREYGIPLSGDIFETIRGLFIEHDLYVIFIHSPRFYGSPVALNEMGAAWVLKTDFCSILTNDMKYEKMKGVVNNAKISIKVDEKDASSILNELYKHLKTVFSLQEMDMNKWERKREQFLSVVRNLHYETVENAVGESDVDIEYKKLQIEKMKAEADARLKAIIRGNIVDGNKGGVRILKIFNAGLSTARNVKVEWLNNSNNVILRGELTDIGDLTPQNSRSFMLFLTIGHPKTMNFRYSWDDDYSLGNTIEESLQL